MQHPQDFDIVKNIYLVKRQDRRDRNAPMPCYISSKFVILNASSSRMRKTSTLTDLSPTRTTASGQEERRPTSSQAACWSRGKSLRNTLWCLLWSALGVKVGSISSTKRQKSLFNSELCFSTASAAYRGL